MKHNGNKLLNQNDLSPSRKTMGAKFDRKNLFMGNAHAKSMKSLTVILLELCKMFTQF